MAEHLGGHLRHALTALLRRGYEAYLEATLRPGQEMPDPQDEAEEARAAVHDAKTMEDC